MLLLGPQSYSEDGGLPSVVLCNIDIVFHLD